MALELLGPQHRLQSCKEPRGETEETCFGCGGVLSGLKYSCSRCKLQLHETCANLPRKKDHPFHRNPLELVAYPPTNYQGKCCCTFCFNRCHGFAYRCSNCDFTLDIKCATSPKFAVGSFPELKHFSHEHPLLSIEKHADEAAQVLCLACEEPLSGPIHSCMECLFHLHSKCLNLPREISHPSHRKHPLLLLAASPDRPLRRFCDVCEKQCRWLVYNCHFCDFEIHVKCAYPPPVLQGEIHEHSFSLLLRRCEFLCDGCGKKGNNCAPYVCTECNLVLHKDCVSLPHSIKVVGDDHPLLHTFSIPKEDPENVICRICIKELNPRHGCYYCSECDYMAHVDCARDKNVWDRSFEKEKDQDHKQHVESSSSGEPSLVPTSLLDEGNSEEEQFSVKKYEIIEGYKRPTVVQHFSHDNYLTLGHEILSKETQCHACMLPIIDSTFFSCSHCKFFLHEDCALFLPSKFKNWCHSHMLTLGSGRIFTCIACKYQSTGFFYGCDRCGGSICLRCNKIPEIFEHPGHEHSLFFDHNYEGHCSTYGNPCGKDSSGYIRALTFKCEKGCDFAVDYPCLTLPRIVRHEYDQHLLMLNFRENESDPHHCVCNICDESRDPKQWFYSCEECKFKAHSKCALGKYPFLDIGNCFKIRAYEHSFKLLKIDDYPSCNKCGEPIIDVALECEEFDCECIIHWECLIGCQAKNFNSLVVGISTLPFC